MTDTNSLRQNGRVRASELVGRNWLNTGGKQLSLEDLRGKIVILDFWTFCCINCLHVLDELRPLEEKHKDVLVTVGVHSPKFEHEADPVAIAAAVERYEIHHPVLDDPELATWQAYGARAWPTLVVVDPEGYIAAHLSGEGHAAGLDALIEELVAEHEAKGTLHRGDGPYVPTPVESGDLRFPGKIARAEDGTYWLADTGHHRIAHLDSDAATLLGAYGTGQKGFADGNDETARFNEPQGLAFLPQAVAEKAGYDLLIADTVNHRLRGLNTATGEVTTVAGNGVQRLIQDPGAAAKEAADLAEQDAATVAISSPWDLVWSSKLNTMVVAMAGTHQIFAFDPVARFDPAAGAVSVLAGTGSEGLLDGPAENSWFAQTSGLAEDKNGDIWLADSETSAIRVLRISGEEAGKASVAVETAIGVGLFDFGYRDGEASEARAQHPLGVTALPDGSVAFADTYNGAVRRFDPASGQVSTLARGLAEPSDVLLEEGEDGEAFLLVVETNKHHVIRVAAPKEALTVDEGASATQRPRTPFAAGSLPLIVRFSAPAGQKLDDRWGDPTQLKISSSPEDFLVEGAGTGLGLTRELKISPEHTEGVLHITARAAACDGEPGGEIPDHAACHLYQQDWGIPVTVVPAGGGEGELVLDLRGVN